MNTVQQYEIEAWLGDDHGLTPDQLDDLTRTAQDIHDRYPDPDDQEERDAALFTALELLTRDPADVVTELGQALLNARLAEARALAALRHAATTLVTQSRSARGVHSQAGFADAAGVSRMTVREWLGIRVRTGTEKGADPN